MSAEDIRTGAFGRVPDELGDPLTEAEVAELPEGAEVVVIWSGGNGPAAGVIVPGPYFVPSSEDPNGPLRYYNPLSFVGSERFHTRVWLAAPITPTRSGGDS